MSSTPAPEIDEVFGPEPCSVVDSTSCLAPPQSERTTRGRCFSCGEAACGNCSLRIAYLTYGTKRICHNCIRDRFDEFDPRVYAHLWVLAGYTAEAGRAAAVRAAAETADIRARQHRS